MVTRNQFVIVRDDLLTDPVTVISEGLLIGRLRECELLLNHPSVSRAQAGIKEIDENYYLFPLRPSNPVTLNGKEVEDNEALAAGDVLGVGPYQIEVDDTEPCLVLRVSLLIGMKASDIDSSSPMVTTDELLEPTTGKKPVKPRASPIPGTKALDIFWDKRIRDAGKTVRHSPLFPLAQRRSGKSQFNWGKTTDLLSRWPTALLVWPLILVGLLSTAAAYAYTNAYTPGPLARGHEDVVMRMKPAIAIQPNAGSCTSCHSWSRDMDKRCADCHRTEAFVATVVAPHEAAGIGCAACHAEHRGPDFKAREGAIASCVECHTDSNKQLYNGKKVGTPHGGTVGYPVVNGVWSLKAVNDEEWELKRLSVVRLETDDPAKWKSKQFHALHSERVKVVDGLQGNALGQLSCSSCHKSFDPIDRDTPRTTCSRCHNGLTESGTNRVLIASDKPNCTSCHVQHIKDVRKWGTSFLSQTNP